MPVIPRFAFWLSIHAGTWLMGVTGCIAGLVWLEGIIANSIARVFVGALAATPFVGLVVVLVNWGWGNSEPSWAKFGEETLSALPLTIVLAGICFLVMRKTLEPVPAAADMPAPIIRSSLLNRLKTENRGNILTLTAEDHYTAVTTSRGHELVLIRFSDALSELDGEDGLQVHRSHWVAIEHVEKLVRENGKLILLLKDGRQVPVSRSFSATVRERLS
nr:LytTR family DNA-binding domain-containing protein [Rhizobium sp. L1K21]